MCVLNRILWLSFVDSCADIRLSLYISRRAQVISGISPTDTASISVTNNSLSFVVDDGSTVMVPVSPGTVTFEPGVPALGTFALDNGGVWQAHSASAFAANGSHVVFTVASVQLQDDFTPVQGAHSDKSRSCALTCEKEGPGQARTSAWRGPSSPTPQFRSAPERR